MEAALEAAQRCFGENTWQDASGKIGAFAGRNIEWHFIGHLQSNKAKAVAQHFQWVHSLDRIEVAQKLAHAHIAAAPLNVLIEINIAHDPRKGGVAPEELPRLLETLLAADLSGIRLRGLMTIAPQTDREPALRARFAQLRELGATMTRQFGLTGFDALSMGMSGDFVAAIREGATLVRVGSAIFGERTAKQR